MLPFVAGCTQSESSINPSGGGTDTATRTPPDIDAYDIRIENKTTASHKVQIKVTSEFGEKTYFDEQTVVEGNGEKSYTEAVSKKEKQVVVAKLDRAVTGDDSSPSAQEFLNDTIRIEPGSSSAPADPTVRAIIKEVNAKYRDEPQKVIDVTYQGRPTETDF